MTRIDSLLAARRADQPRVDFSRFHRQVMDQVTAEAARPVTIRLANFLRVAMPLAAAASIALIVWLWPHGGPLAPGSHDLTGPGLVARVSEPAVDSDDGIHVSYAKSDQLAKEFQAEDEKARSRESSQTFLAGNVRPSQSISPELLAEAAPLY